MANDILYMLYTDSLSLVYISCNVMKRLHTEQVTLIKATWGWGIDNHSLWMTKFSLIPSLGQVLHLLHNHQCVHHAILVLAKLAKGCNTLCHLSFTLPRALYLSVFDHAYIWLCIACARLTLHVRIPSIML